MSKSLESNKKPWPYYALWNYLDSIDYNITEEDFQAEFEELKKKSLNAFSEVAKQNQEQGKSVTSKDIEKEVEDTRLPKIIQEFIKGRKENKSYKVIAPVVAEETQKTEEVVPNQEQKKETIKTAEQTSHPVVENKTPEVVSSPIRKIDPIKLQKQEKVKFLDRFKNLGFSLGLFGGRRSKLKSAFDNAEFAVSRNGVAITKNSKDSNLVQVTFDGNCDNVAIIPVGHGCYVKAAYNKENGLVDIASNRVFRFGENGEEKEINLHKKGGFFGRLFGTNGDLEKQIGKSEATEVRRNFKNLKLLVCSNPKGNQNSDYCSTDGVAALIDGKTHGVRMGRKSSIAAATLLAGAGTVAVLTGVGVIPGAAAIGGAATIVGTTIAKTSTSAALATASFAHTSAYTVGAFAQSSAGHVASTQSYHAAANFFKTDVGIATGAGTTGLVVGGAALAVNSIGKTNPNASAKKSSAKPLDDNKSKSQER